MSPKETSEITLARFAGEGRGEGSHALPPHPDPLPHEDVVERESFLSASSRRDVKPLAFKARVV
jgi:hypothetical protein